MKWWIELALGYIVLIVLSVLFVLALISTAAQLYAGSS